MYGNTIEAIIKQTIFRKGKRINLRPIFKEDLPQLTIWVNDIEMTKYLTIPYPKTIEDENLWLESFNKKKTTDIVLAIVINKTKKLIGLIGLHEIDHINGTAMIGLAIGDKTSRNKGYGTETINLILEYSFKTLNLRKVCANILDFNERSKACLEKCGFKKEGVKKEQFYKNGTFVDEILMSIFKKDF